MPGQVAGHSTLGSKVRVLRDSKGWTVEQLAVYSGLSVATVSRIERDLVKPYRSTLTMLARALDSEDLAPELREAA